jgi:hypothetical protein
MVSTRRSERYPVDVPARLRLDLTEQMCRISNISLGGVCIVGPALPSDARATLKFTAPHVDSFTATCVVRWCAISGLGLEFVGLRAAETYQLGRYLRQLARTTQKLTALDPKLLRPPARS